MLRRAGLSLLSLLAFSTAVLAQDRLPLMEGWKQHTENRPKLSGAYQLANLRVIWVEEGKFAYQDGQEWVIHNCKTGEEKRQAEKPAESETAVNNRRRPGRGRQFTEITSPDGTAKVTYRNRNLVLSAGGKETQITQEGNDQNRVKFGQASWVYGEELGQSEAMGFSPNGKQVWFYRFDESQVLDYHLTVAQNSPQSSLEVEAYPKPGQPNPMVDLMVYSLETGKTTTIQSRPGAFDDGLGHYLYGIKWRPDGNRLLFYRTDRKQKILEYCSADPASGEVKVLDREENPEAWVENSCPTTYLDELPEIKVAPKFANQALWMSERSGYLNLYLLDLEKGGVKPVTKHEFDVRQVIRVDLKAEKVWYMALSSASGRSQLHWASLNGKKSERMTDPELDHSVQISPEGKWVVDRAESIRSLPEVRLLDAKGKVVRVLKKSTLGDIKSLGYQPVMGFEYVSADGKTPLVGALHYPANFDPSRKYPVVFDVYNGPLGPMADSWNDTIRQPALLTDFGFIVVQVETRGGGGRGRAFKNALYQKMGIVEIDDMAQAAVYLKEFPWFDSTRVGIEGTSYGGYATLMAMTRHPEVFRAGASQSCVSQWANYDTTYTERYMGLLPESAAAYAASSAVAGAKNVRGWLMIYYGTADDNTHPANSLQMIKALQDAGKSFEVQVGVDVGHSGMNVRRMAEFFIERLKLGS